MEIPRIYTIRLPEKMKELVDGIATKEKVNQQMVIPFFLATLASLGQAKFEVSIGDGKKIPLGFYALLVAESATGKTPILEKFTEPLDALIENNNVKIREINDKIDVENKIIDLNIKKIMKEGIKCDWDREELANEIMKLEKKKAPKLSPADIYNTNTTGAGLARALREQEGHRFGILDSEGSSLLHACRDRLLISQLNYAYDNSAFSAARAKNDIKQPVKGVASLVIGMQPEKFKSLWGKEYFWHEGLMPRMLPFFGEYLPVIFSRREINNFEEVYKYYKEKVKYLFHYPWKMNDVGGLEAHALTLHPDAVHMYEKYKNILAPSIGGEDFLVRQWRVKAIQKILRIAALFHLYEVDGDPVTTPISPNHIELAGELLCDLIPNVEYMRELVAPIEYEKIFQHVISWLHKRFGQSVFTVRDISRSTNMKSGPLLKVLGRLLREGVLDEYEEPRRSSVGRVPEGGFILNWGRLMKIYPPNDE